MACAIDSCIPLHQRELGEADKNVGRHSELKRSKHGICAIALVLGVAAAMIVWCGPDSHAAHADDLAAPTSDGGTSRRLFGSFQGAGLTPKLRPSRPFSPSSPALTPSKPSTPVFTALKRDVELPELDKNLLPMAALHKKLEKVESEYDETKLHMEGILSQIHKLRQKQDGNTKGLEGVIGLASFVLTTMLTRIAVAIQSKFASRQPDVTGDDRSSDATELSSPPGYEDCYEALRELQDTRGRPVDTLRQLQKANLYLLATTAATAPLCKLKCATGSNARAGLAVHMRLRHNDEGNRTAYPRVQMRQSTERHELVGGRRELLKTAGLGLGGLLPLGAPRAASARSLRKFDVEEEAKVLKPEEYQSQGYERLIKELGAREDDGSFAVMLPRLEDELLNACQTLDNGKDEVARKIVDALEARGGSQLPAASGRGRWVLPTVGAWQSLWTNTADMSHAGGPTTTGFNTSGAAFTQLSARQFIYGPGQDGITVEYLHEANNDSPKRLLTRQGNVNNLGGNFFSLDFPSPFLEFETRTDAYGEEKLLTGERLKGGSECAAPIFGLECQTTYLSESLWIFRGAANPDRVAVFQRTNTVSVVDRRGLVAEGQVKPPEQDSVRFGGLLFGDTLSDYQNWDKQQEINKQEKDKLLGNK